MTDKQENRRAYLKKYHQTYGKKYRAKNREKRNSYMKLYSRERYAKDVEFRLAVLLRTRLRDALGNNYRSGSSIRDLGCSVSELKEHLERQFLEGMSWGNQGYYGWHIDHIAPLSSFNLSNRDEFLVACHYTNLRPLWWLDNIKKHATV